MLVLLVGRLSEGEWRTPPEPSASLTPVVGTFSGTVRPPGERPCSSPYAVSLPVPWLDRRAGRSGHSMDIDTGFDFRSDAGGRDPDRHSPTLRRYHRLLWSKRLPNGAMFDLDDATPGEYLHHKSALGEFWLASDSVIPSFLGYVVMDSVLDHFAEAEIELFQTIGYTIGGMIVFPSNRIDGKQTVNGARGFHPRIRDRMDLTLECIRRHYAGADPQGYPLGNVLARYADFFALFEDFQGYVQFFLLDDLVTDDYAGVRFFLPFDDFATPALPLTVEAYRRYRDLSAEFVEARNRRIDALD